MKTMMQSLHYLAICLLLFSAGAEEVECQSEGTCSESQKMNINDDNLAANDARSQGLKTGEPQSQTMHSRIKHDKPRGNSVDESSTLNHPILYYETPGGRIRIPEPPLVNTQCNLFMAESSIPFAGWGMYTGIPLNEGDAIQPLDLAIQVQDQTTYEKRVNAQHFTPSNLPSWLMHQYYWNARVTDADYDAKSIDSIIPSFGMLANSHTGLVNLRNQGCARIERGGNGAQTVYREQTFTLWSDLEAGHELFADYGDAWFEEREETYGPMPLSKDWKKADKVIKEFDRLCSTRENVTGFCDDLWKLVRGDLLEAEPSRLSRALPEDMAGIPVALKQGTAKASLSNVVRSLDWLFANGMCLDHMTPKDSTLEESSGMGAFATRFLPRGSLVAPAPLVHMHRDHLAVLITDPNDWTRVLWQGRQLILNYCYGHPSSSLVFFPYSPVVNFINHSSKNPNVRLQWSSKMFRKEWLNLTTDQVLQNDHSSGLMMEFVALRDIEEGEEILYDYGPAFEKALNDFKPEKLSPRKEAEDLKGMKTLPVWNGKSKLPDNVMTVCWIPDLKNMKPVKNEKNSYYWAKTSTRYLDATDECWIQSVSRSTPTSYNITFYSDKQKLYVKGLPRRAIAIVDRPYTKAQYRRKSFRHEIHLPDDMIPVGWRDLDSYSPECGLYMAESSIPNSGLGMYSARKIEEGKHVFHGDVVVQVFDFKVNQRLRRWYHNIAKENEPDWLLANYFWDADNTLGTFEADKVYSIVPGMGMLANSHPGLVNSDMRRPKLESGGIHRHTHPSAGSSTMFHDLTFVTLEEVEPGTELFVEYGDSWFRDREDLGQIPLSNDFIEANAILDEFYRLVGEDVDSEMARDLWDIFWNTSSDVEDSRVRNAIPRDLKRVPEVRRIGTAKNSVPNQVRSIEWLKKNGLCLDNIKSGMSRIEGAHRGAFATRPLAKGQVIAPMPVAHILREHLEIFNSQDVQDATKKPWFESNQLLLNYCYGHANSTVLLFPYSPVVNYVNHSPKNFNAELKWSNFSTQRQQFKEMTPDQLVTHDHSGLILELVATRDIAFGEEILLNYGDRWEHAWQKMVESWSFNKLDDDYVPASELNDFMTPVKTLTEEESDPYPSNVATICFAKFSGKAIDTTEDDESVYEWKYKPSLFETFNNAYICDVLERSEDSKKVLDGTVGQILHKYEVRLYRPDEANVIIRNVPRSAIEFFDNEYRSDTNVNASFKHEIGLPDHLLPTLWANRK